MYVWVWYISGWLCSGEQSFIRSDLIVTLHWVTHNFLQWSVCLSRCVYLACVSHTEIWISSNLQLTSNIRDFFIKLASFAVFGGIVSKKMKAFKSKIRSQSSPIQVSNTRWNSMEKENGKSYVYIYPSLLPSVIPSFLPQDSAGDLNFNLKCYGVLTYFGTQTQSNTMNLFCTTVYTPN